MKGLLLNEYGDLMVEKGSLVVGDNTHQVIQSVLQANLGEFKEFPLVGAGVMTMQNGTIDKMWSAQTVAMLAVSGVRVNRVKMSEQGVITIE